MLEVLIIVQNVKKDKNTALNKTGKAYMNFEPKGKGQIEIEINGQMTVTDAINNSETEIKAFDLIKEQLDKLH